MASLLFAQRQDDGKLGTLHPYESINIQQNDDQLPKVYSALLFVCHCCKRRSTRTFVLLYCHLLRRLRTNHSLIRVNCKKNCCKRGNGSIEQTHNVWNLERKISSLVRAKRKLKRQDGCLLRKKQCKIMSK